MDRSTETRDWINKCHLLTRHNARDRPTSADAYLEQAAGDAPNGADEMPEFNTPVRVTLIHARKRLADLDNLSVKAAIDGCIACGILADDSPQQVAEIRTRQVKADRESTVIQIEVIE